MSRIAREIERGQGDRVCSFDSRDWITANFFFLVVVENNVGILRSAVSVETKSIGVTILLYIQVIGTDVWCGCRIEASIGGLVGFYLDYF